MNILITGGTGFIGSRLASALLAEDHHMVFFCRSVDKAQQQWSESRWFHQITFVSDFNDIVIPIDAVINLAGEPIVGQRWTEKRKQQLADSRIGLTRQLVTWLSQQSYRPEVFISGSAIGVYGNYPEDIDVDEAASSRDCYPSQLCQQWEFEALKAKSLGARVCLLRTGVVLDKQAGALQKMWLPFSMGLGGNVGSGRQWFSWIHIDDMVDGILFLLRHSSIDGAVNMTAPTPVTYRQFTQTFARMLKRPHLIPMPAFALKLVLGEAAQLLIEGQKVVPKKLADAGFRFSFSTIDSALYDVVH